MSTKQWKLTKCCVFHSVLMVSKTGSSDLNVCSPFYSKTEIASIMWTREDRCSHNCFVHFKPWLGTTCSTLTRRIVLVLSMRRKLNFCRVYTQNTEEDFSLGYRWGFFVFDLSKHLLCYLCSCSHVRVGVCVVFTDAYTTT